MPSIHVKSDIVERINMQELNHAQKRAVSHFEGPCLVLAGPGSGKTRVITERIHFLIQERGVPPTRILVITFTKAAAEQMQERYQNLYHRDSSKIHFGTFHAIFFKILRQEYHYTIKNVIYGEKKHMLLRRIVREMDLELQDENEFLNDLESEISRIKGNRLELRECRPTLCEFEDFREIFEEYQRTIKKKSLLDFDDMLLYCYELLSTKKNILSMWQEQFSYILIDEFQDISLVQYEIMKMLAVPENNLFIVGDDDQSIYGFRGARPDIMKQFLKDYPDAEQCLLNINYRSVPAITEMAGRVIRHNRERMPKKIISAKEDIPMLEMAQKMVVQRNQEEMEMCVKNGTEEVFTIRKFSKASEENDAICEKIERYLKQGTRFGEIAVLFRTNIQARALSVKLAEHQIPFVLNEHLSNIYDHWIVQDILTYIQIAGGNRERGRIWKIINRPVRYIRRDAFTEPCVDFDELKRYYEDEDWMVERIETLQYQLELLSKMKPYAAVHFIRKGIGYDDYIREYAASSGNDETAMFEILEEILEAAGKFETIDAWFRHIQEYREMLMKQAGKNEAEKEGVFLLTMHGSKGLEYTCVFLPDANEGVTPYGKAVLDSEIEEERRMFYVAMTRAKSHLHISYVEERFGKAAAPSRFIEEIIL